MTGVIGTLGEINLGTAAVTLERDTMTLVIKNVSVHIRGNRGEPCLNEQISTRLRATTQKAAEVRE
jgi:hypothetical protein